VAPSWSGTSLFTHPNAGNGYQRQSQPDGDDPLWWDLEAPPRRKAPSPSDTFNHPLCNQILDHVNAQIRRGHDDAVVDLLWELSGLDRTPS